MNHWSVLFLMVVASAVIAVDAPRAATTLLEVEVSPQVTVDVSGVVIADHEAMAIAAGPVVTLVAPGPLPVGVDVDALHRVDATTMLVSLDITSVLGADTVDDADVVSYDGIAWSVVFDASAAGLPIAVDVDAVSVAPDGALLLSFDTSVEVDGVVFADEDVARYAGGVFTMQFDGSAAGIASELDLGALHALPDGTLLFAFDAASAVAGVNFSAAGVLVHSPAAGTWELAFSAADHPGWTNGVDALAASGDHDGDGVRDNLDNCSTTPNPDQRDTDSDGFGNGCDPDFDQSCLVNFVDLQRMKSVFFGADDHADLNGDGLVNFADLVILKLLFFGPPGPSGTPHVCDSY